MSSGGRGTRTPPDSGPRPHEVSPEMSPRQFQRMKSKCVRAPDARPCACVSEEQGLPIFLLDFNLVSFLYFLIIFVSFWQGKIPLRQTYSSIDRTEQCKGIFFAKSSSLSLPVAHICGLRFGTIAEYHTICVKITTTHTLRVSESCTCMEGAPALPERSECWGECVSFLEPLT